MPAPVFRYLIWDFDGTLVDAYPALIEALCRALAEYGVVGEPERIARLSQQSLSYAVSTYAEANDIDVETLGERYMQHYRAMPDSAQPPFAGVAALCRRVVAAGGANYIVTHRGRASLVRLLDHHKMLDLFADFVTADDDYPRKPDPAAFVAIIERHRLPRATTLGVGDRDLDIRAAQAAGVKACLFAGALSEAASESGAFEEAATPDYVVHDYAALEAILFPPE